MPIGAWAHSQYWRAHGGAGGGPPGNGNGKRGRGFVPWQTTVIISTSYSLLGPLQVVYEAIREAVRWYRVVRSLSTTQRAVLARVVGLLVSPEYVTARESVTATAQILGFNKPTAWQSLVTALKADPSWTENHWRHVQAMQGLADTPLTNPEKNLLTELAYHAHALRVR